jgi:hypothetical protein
MAATLPARAMLNPMCRFAFRERMGKFSRG